MKCYAFFGVILSVFAHPSTAQNNCIHTYTEDRHIHISRIDLNCKNVQLVASNAQDQGRAVSEFAQKYQTAVAINGSFFRKDGSPIGLNITDFKKWGKSQDTRARSFLACTSDNQCQIDPKNSLAKINPKWKIAVAGWHRFNAKSGKFECAPSDKVGCSQSIFTDKHPRTMVGLDQKRNWLYFVVVEGRQLTTRGMTLDQLAELAQKLQLTQALNLDGGGSSTMVVGTKRISALPLLQSGERGVGNMVGVKFILK